MSSFSSSHFARPMSFKVGLVMRGQWVTRAEADLIDAGKMEMPKPVGFRPEGLKKQKRRRQTIPA